MRTPAKKSTGLFGNAFGVRPPTYQIDFNSAIGWKCLFTGKSKPMPETNSSGLSSSEMSSAPKASDFGLLFRM